VIPCDTSMKAIVLRSLALIAMLSTTACVRAAEPWDAPFAGDPRAILEVAKLIPVPDEQMVIVLLEQHRYVIDENGRTLSKVRKVLRIVTGEGVEEWSSIEQEYQPWHESKPEMRARVIGADGAVHWLDGKTIADSPASEYDQNIFSDRRVVRAPLPAVGVGTIVEYEIVTRETAPLFNAGEARRVTIFDSVPIRRFQLSIEAAESVPLKIVTKLIPESAIQHVKNGGKTQFNCEIGPLEPRNSTEGNLPSDVPGYPYVSFSTGRTWQEMAAKYEAIVDQQIKTGNLAPLIEGVDSSGGPKAIAAQLTAKLHREVRYTGVEFGEAEIVPRTPEETLKRKYGDCKDKASLLVAALRAKGLRAYIALLDAGFGTDVDQDLPGLGVFNHAIVYVAGDHPLWIDATSAESRVGDLPTMDQGRFALIASRGTAALERTPESSAEDNKRTHTIEIHLSDFGAGEIRETVEAQGYMETRLRQAYDGSDVKKLKDALEKYVKRDFLAKSVEEFSATRKDDFSQRFRLELQAKGAKRAITEQDDAMAVLFPSLVLSELPYPLRQGMRGNREEEKTELRKNDFVFVEPHIIEYHYKIYPPEFFKPKDLPSSVDAKIGTAEYQRNYQVTSDGSVDVVFRFSTGKRRLNATEYGQLREGLRKYEEDSATPEMLTFVALASEYVAMGETEKAVKLVQESAAKHEGEAGGQVRWSRMLVTAGAVDSAITVAKKVVEKDPSSGQGWQALGWTYEHDSFGRRFAGNWNSSEAEKCFREAIKLDGNDFIPRWELAILLEVDAHGQRYGKGARLDEAIEQYREILKTNPIADVAQSIAVDLLYAGRYTEAKEELKKLQGADFQATLSTVLTAITDSSARAIIDSRARIPDERARAANLVNASGVLAGLRQYDRAYDLLKAAGRSGGAGDLQSRMDQLLKMRRYETALYPENDPRYPVQQAILEAYSAQPDFERLKPFFTKRDNWTALREDFARRWRNFSVVRNRLASYGLSQENILDSAVSALEVKKPDGGASGYRVNAASSMTPLPVMYVVEEGGKYKIIGTTGSPEMIGERVLDLLSRNQIKDAQWWLDLVVPDLQNESSEEGGSPAARLLWSGIVEATRGPTAITNAAASLIGPYNGSNRAIQMLTDGRGQVSNPIERGQIDLALCGSLARAERWDELMTVAKRLESTRPFEGEGLRFMAKAAGKSGNWKELQVEAERKLKNASGDRDALRAMATSKIQSGDRDEAARYLKRLTDSPYAAPGDVQFEAWNALLSGKADRELLTKFEKWSEIPELASADYLYTFGILQVSVGAADDAQRSLIKALDRDYEGARRAIPWVLASKIDERYGLADAASSAGKNAAKWALSDEISKWALSLVNTTKMADDRLATPNKANKAISTPGTE
jgi:tetratricopeptide (TPR) repeat protein